MYLEVLSLLSIQLDFTNIFGGELGVLNGLLVKNDLSEVHLFPASFFEWNL